MQLLLLLQDIFLVLQTSDDKITAIYKQEDSICPGK